MTGEFRDPPLRLDLGSLMDPNNMFKFEEAEASQGLSEEDKAEITMEVRAEAQKYYDQRHAEQEEGIAKRIAELDHQLKDMENRFSAERMNLEKQIAARRAECARVATDIGERRKLQLEVEALRIPGIEGLRPDVMLRLETRLREDEQKLRRFREDGERLSPRNRGGGPGGAGLTSTLMTI